MTDDRSNGEVCILQSLQALSAGLDIGLINKYYDLARAGDTLAVEHYRALEKTAADCVHCGHCDRRCPFSVKQSDRMREIARYMDVR